MNIVLATDDNYAQHCAVVMASVITHNCNVSFYIINDGLSPPNEEKLKSVITQNTDSVEFVMVDKIKIQSMLPMPDNSETSHISIATYYRLFLAELLPADIEKVLYLDCDMVVRGSLLPFYDTDLDGKALAACYLNNAFGRVKNVYERLGYSEDYKYFNAGALCLNLKYWRENDVQGRLLAFARNNMHNIVYHDQDILNAVLHREVVHVSPLYNMDLSYITEDEAQNYDLSFDKLLTIFMNPVVVHYVSRPKPWEYACNHPYCGEYFKYLDKTANAGWRPAFCLNNAIKYILKPKLQRVRNILLNR